MAESDVHTGNSRPDPDPTRLTTEQLERSIRTEREITDREFGVLNERLRGIDTATKLLNETVNRVPTDVTKEVTHLRELMEGSLESIALQFRERDTRSERESKDNKVAVDAAFAAQKEAASEQNKSNTLAIGKSETATTESINKLAELFKTNTSGLADKIDDLKERVSRMESIKQGVAEFKGETHAGISSVTQIIGAVIAVVAIVLTLYATRSHPPDPVVVPPQVVTVTTPAP